MRLKARGYHKERSGRMMSALVLDRGVKTSDGTGGKECVGRQAANEGIDLQDDFFFFLKRNGPAQNVVPIDFCGVRKKGGRERSVCVSWVCTAGIRFLWDASHPTR